MAISTINQSGLNAPLTLTSPVLTTPNLGTPSALVLTNATGAPAAINLTNATALPASALPTGSVKQVVSVNDTTTYVFNSGGQSQSTYYNVTGLVASITPSSASNKILVLSQICASQANNVYNAFFRVTRNGTVVGAGNSSGYNATSTSAMRTSDGGEIGTVAIMYLDSPASTSSVTYQIQICSSGGSGYPSYVNRPANGNTGWEQTGASSIILMEVVG